uniref:PH domain and leucine rich repeat protein phosphatase 2 n=1 Tax=Cyprinus carpio TaxID=7962 RepID=A0A8C2BHM1_CYPCA
MKRNGSRGCVTRKTRFGSRERDWLKGDAQRGCVCLYGASEPQPPASGPQTSTSTQPDLKLVLCSTNTTAEELCAQRDVQGLYLQLHGDLIRKIDNFDPCNVLLAIATNTPMSFMTGFGSHIYCKWQLVDCCVCVCTEKPVNADQQERTLLKGVFSVRKGKTQLHKWAERQVILCGTSLIVASVKDSLTGKMHILPLVGGKVEEVKRRQHCLMFSSAGPQAQTYYVNFDTLADYQRWHRQASKVVSQTISLVDLSCYSLEEVPEYLFYCQDVTHLNLRHNFMSLDGPGGLVNFSR